MDYIKVTNPGSTYASLATNQDPEFWGANITNRVLPIRGRTYRVIKELDHPASPGVRLMTIMDDSWTAFIIGIDGVEESSVVEFYGTEEEVYATPSPEPIKVKQQKPIRPIPVKSKSEYIIGDIIIITDSGHHDFGKKFRVTDPNYRGYDVVTSRSETGVDKSMGFHFGQFQRYIPELEILPEDKPRFSTNELLEVLNQLNKTPEEMILDLMDHITN